LCAEDAYFLVTHRRHGIRSTTGMSTNSILAVLYVELGIFVVGILAPLAVKFFAGFKSSNEQREQPVGSGRRGLAVSRLSA
jgi:hypothetical protein